jgi:hypothetical protein
MMDYHELKQRFYVYTPLGVALCVGYIFGRTEEQYLLHVCWQLETKEQWTWANSEVRLCGSNTAKRDDYHSPIHLGDDRLEFLLPHIKRHKDSPFYWKVNQ